MAAAAAGLGALALVGGGSRPGGGEMRLRAAEEVLAWLDDTQAEAWSWAVATGEESYSYDAVLYGPNDHAPTPAYAPGVQAHPSAVDGVLPAGEAADTDAEISVAIGDGGARLVLASVAVEGCVVIDAAGGQVTGHSVETDGACQAAHQRDGVVDAGDGFAVEGSIDGQLTVVVPDLVGVRSWQVECFTASGERLRAQASGSEPVRFEAAREDYYLCSAQGESSDPAVGRLYSDFVELRR